MPKVVVGLPCAVEEQFSLFKRLGAAHVLVPAVYFTVVYAVSDVICDAVLNPAFLRSFFRSPLSKSFKKFTSKKTINPA